MDFILVALLVLTGFWMFNNVSKKKEIVETKENRENNIIPGLQGMVNSTSLREPSESL